MLSAARALGAAVAAFGCQQAAGQDLKVDPPATVVPKPDGLEQARSIVADIQRIVTPDGIDQTMVLELGSARQVVNIRGANRANPILLYIHGGPGSVEMPMAWSFQRPWEDFFTVVQWDQRGAGRSFALNDPDKLAPTLNLDRYRDDAIELIEQLRFRLGQRKVFVLGHSFGSAVGLAVAAKRPDLLYAYIGMGQLIDFRENERVGMAHTLQVARKRGDAEAVRVIEALRPYPDSGPFTIEQADAWRAYANKYGSLAGQRVDAGFYFASAKLSPLYTPKDRLDWDAGSAFTVKALWPRLADVSFTSLNTMSVPVVLFLGRYDSTTPSPIAAAWINRLQAPSRTLCWFENSGHLPMIEEQGRTFAALLSVRSLSEPTGSAHHPSAAPDSYCHTL
jgi:pimeloyl-ACP methyl ester carboxylesterase